MTQTILDISRWQGDLDVSKMQAKGIEVVKLRVSIGNYYRDTRFREYYDLLNPHFQLGGYLVVRADNSTQSQLDNYKTHVGGRKFDIPDTVDAEVVVATELDRRQKTMQIAQGLEDMHGMPPEMYSNYNFMQNMMGDNSIPSVRESNQWVLRYPLHLAYYYLDGCDTDNESVHAERIPEPYRTAGEEGKIPQPYLLWQFCDKGLGSEYGTSSSSVDVNKPWPGLDYNNLYNATAPEPPAGNKYTDGWNEAMQEIQDFAEISKK